MGGSSLAPEMICRTVGAGLTVLDSTEPGQVLAALRERLDRTVLVVASKSGSTLETDSQRRSYEAASSRVSGSPSRRMQMLSTSPTFAVDSSKSGFTERARSTNSWTASDSAELSSRPTHGPRRSA